MAKILIVQDDEIQELMLKFFVQRFGYEPICASSLTDALRILYREPVTIALIDCCLKDAAYFAKMARRLNRTVPLLMLTGHCMLGEREQFLKAGMNDFLSKPFCAKDLKSFLDKWIAKNSRASEIA